MGDWWGLSFALIGGWGPSVIFCECLLAVLFEVL